jgi:hypothetical protein
VTLPPRPGPSPIRPRDGQTDHETNSVSEFDGGASGGRWRWGRYRRVGPQISVDGDVDTHGSEVRGFCLLGDSSLVRLEVGGWRRGHHLGRERRVVAGGAIGPRRDTRGGPRSGSRATRHALRSVQKAKKKGLEVRLKSVLTTVHLLPGTQIKSE